MTLVVAGDGTPRSYFFRDLARLEIFQRDMETLLLKTGWSFQDFEPDRRAGRDRRGWPRRSNDRRRWWTDGQSTRQQRGQERAGRRCRPNRRRQRRARRATLRSVGRRRARARHSASCSCSAPAPCVLLPASCFLITEAPGAGHARPNRDPVVPEIDRVTPVGGKSSPAGDIQCHWLRVGEVRRNRAGAARRCTSARRSVPLPRQVQRSPSRSSRSSCIGVVARSGEMNGASVPFGMFARSSSDAAKPEPPQLAA